MDNGIMTRYQWLMGNLETQQEKDWLESEFKHFEAGPPKDVEGNIIDETLVAAYTTALDMLNRKSDQYKHVSKELVDAFWWKHSAHGDSLWETVYLKYDIMRRQNEEAVKHSRLAEKTDAPMEDLSPETAAAKYALHQTREAEERRLARAAAIKAQETEAGDSGV